MNQQRKEYTQQLIIKHGHLDALRIMEKSLEASRRGAPTIFYDEADFSVNDSGIFELSKTKNKKKEARQMRRVKGNINFYSDIIRLIKKELENDKA